MSVEERKAARRRRLEDLRGRRRDILLVAEPIRAERDAFVAKHGPLERELNKRLKEAETGLFDIDMEIAELVKLGV